MTGPFGFSDDARRMSDAINQAIVDGHRGRWMAFAIGDGTCDGKTYDTRRDAIRYHTNRARLYMYIKVPWDGCTPRAAEAFLGAHRQLAAIGQHVADDELPDTEWMFDNRRETHPRDRRRLLLPDAAARDGYGRLRIPRGMS